MEKITTVGLDLAEQVMVAHGVGADGRMVLRKALGATSYWAGRPGFRPA
jgi:hypothetical protein